VLKTQICITRLQCVNSILCSVIISCQCSLLLDHLTNLSYALGYAVVQLVEALCYKSEGPGSIPDGVTGIFY